MKFVPGELIIVISMNSQKLGAPSSPGEAINRPGAYTRGAHGCSALELKS